MSVVLRLSAEETPVMENPDYEAPARALYKNEPNYESKWPVEFHIRIMEGLLHDLQLSITQLGTPYYDDAILRERPILLENLKSAPTKKKGVEDSREVIISSLYTNLSEVVWGVPGQDQNLPAGITRSIWKINSAAQMNGQSINEIWKQYLSGFSYLDRITIKVKKGSVPSPGRFDTVTALEFAGRENSASEGWRRDYGKAEIRFEKTATGWQISRFALLEMTTDRSLKRMFEDATSEWIDPLPEEIRIRLTAQSKHNDLYQMLVTNKKSRILFSSLLGDAHARVSVVDIDSDSWDDLLVCDILGEAILLHNVRASSGRRGFEYANDRFNLHLYDVNSVIFADLNQDGILDIIAGRWTSSSEILLGARIGPDKTLQFLPAKVNRKGILPSKVSAVAVADVNGDAYLDIFFATADMDYHKDQSLEGDTTVDRKGPPDVLLVNLGDGDFADLTERFGLTHSRSTLAASFGDLNSDSIPDLVLANDFAPAIVYLNEQGVRFRDITAEYGAEKAFFGMGTSWGDFDNDQDLDIYLTAMQSSAGQRITSDDANFSSAMTPGRKEDRILAVRGNVLLRNESGKSFSAASDENPFSMVRNANWAYGAQFVDINNDSFLDIYSPNGHFTFPRDPTKDIVVRDF